MASDILNHSRARAASAALGFLALAPIVGSSVKERLTGAIILVALIVLLVPELLTGPIGSAPRAAAVAPSPEEPPLRSYTINLADDTHSRTAAVITSGPQPPTPLSAAAGPSGMSAAQLAQRLARPAGEMTLALSVAAGCERARAAARPGDRVVVCGSVYTVGPALQWLRIY